MTASYARAKTREWCEEVATLTGIPFYDTINIPIKTTVPVWFTVQFYAEFMEGTFCQKGYRETGFVEVFVISQPGLGDTQAIEAIEFIVPNLYNKVDNTQRFTFESYGPIIEGTEGSADSTYRVSVALNYAHSL